MDSVWATLSSIKTVPKYAATEDYRAEALLLSQAFGEAAYGGNDALMKARGDTFPFFRGTPSLLLFLPTGDHRLEL